MSERFIIYRAYKDLSTIECLLMSWIISLNEAKQTICFSNEYASKQLKVSDRTITNSISKLKSLGFINTYITREKRFIYLVKEPELENISLEACDLDRVENISTRQENISTRQENISTQTGNNFHPDPKIFPPRVENSSTYNKEYNKDNNATLASYETDTRFTKLVELFPKSKQKGIQEAYDYTWIFLKEEDKKQIEKILPVYIQRNKEEPKFVKPVNKYFNEKFWITDDISLSLLKGKTIKSKPQIIL